MPAIIEPNDSLYPSISEDIRAAHVSMDLAASSRILEREIHRRRQTPPQVSRRDELCTELNGLRDERHELIDIYERSEEEEEHLGDLNDQIEVIENLINDLDIVGSCRLCSRNISDEDYESATWVHDLQGLVCGQCRDNDNMWLCNGCYNFARSGRHVPIHYRDHVVSFFCEDCRRARQEDGRLFHCDSCCNFLFPDDPAVLTKVGNICGNCVESICARGDILYRPYTETPSLLEYEEGEIIKSQRSFGIELECIAPNRKAASTASMGTANVIGLGSDGSVEGKGAESGLEFQTPPAIGKAAEDMIKGLCETLSKSKFNVNMSCGFHVHIDSHDLFKLQANQQLQAIKNIWTAYLAYEDVFISLLPESRRSNNHYCSGLKTEYSVDEILRAQNFQELEQLWYRRTSISDVTAAKGQHRHPTRYRGINLHPFFSDGHLEIRYHSGTINPRKILEWVNLHLRFYTWAANRSSSFTNSSRGFSNHDTPAFVKLVSNNLDTAAKTKDLFNQLGLSEDSKGYFMARQEKFKKSHKIEKSEAFKTGMKLLEDEQES